MKMKRGCRRYIRNLDVALNPVHKRHFYCTKSVNMKEKKKSYVLRRRDGLRLDSLLRTHDEVELLLKVTFELKKKVQSESSPKIWHVHNTQNHTNLVRTRQCFSKLYFF